MSFGLRVSSDCDDARSIGTRGSPLLLPISVFLRETISGLKSRVVLLLDP